MAQKEYVVYATSIAEGQSQSRHPTKEKALAALRELLEAYLSLGYKRKPMGFTSDVLDAAVLESDDDVVAIAVWLDIVRGERKEVGDE